MQPTIPGVKHSYQVIKQTRLHVAEVGKGQPLLLLHGWPQHWYVWHKIIPLLSSKFRLIMPDLPGLGWSDPVPNKDYTKENLADYIIALTEQLGLKKIILVGHDWGGWIGFLACLKRPDLFRNYLALGIGTPFSTKPIPFFELRRLSYQLLVAAPFLGKFILQHGQTIIQKGLYRCVDKSFTWNKKDIALYLNALKNPVTAYASSLLYRDFLIKEAKEIIAGKYKKTIVQVPTTLLVGKQDPVIHATIVGTIPEEQKNISLAYVDHCGHFIPEEKPELVAANIRAFNQK